MSLATVTLFANQAAQASSSWVKVLADRHDPEKEQVVHVRGVLASGSGTIKVQASNDPTASPANPIDITDASFTASFHKRYKVPPGYGLRVDLSGVGSPVPDWTVVATGPIATV